MQIARSRQSRHSGVLILAFGLLCACGDADRGAETAGQRHVIATADEAAAHVRSLYFAQASSAAARQGERLVGAFPESPELAAWHVLALARNGDRDEARARVEELLERHPDDAWSRFALAAAFMWNGEVSREQALDASAAAYAANPEHDDFLWVRAESLRLRDGKDEGIAFLDSHEERLNASPHLLNVRAAALFDLALEDPSDAVRRAAALEAYARARALDPRNVNAWFEPGWFLDSLGRPDEAYPLLKRAATLSRARRVQITYWASVVQRSDLSLAEKRAEVDASISRLLDSPGVDAELLPGAAAVYEKLGLEQKQQAIEERILADYPQSPMAEHVLMHRLSDRLMQGAADQPEFVDALRQFLAREPIHEPLNQRNAQVWLFNAIRHDPEVDPRELLDLVLAMSRQEGAKFTAHSEGAIALASRKLFLEEAERLATEGVSMVPALAEQALQSIPAAVRPDAGTPHDPTDFLEASMRDALGWVRFNQGRVEDAERELLSAYELDAERPSVLLHLAALYESRGQFDRAETFFIRCAALPMREGHPCANVLHDYYVRRRGSSAGFDDYLETIRDRLLAESKARVTANRLPRPVAVPPFSLTTLDGRPVALADLRGKFAIVKFWAVWCGPCRIEMAPFADFVARFADVPDLEILTINLDPNPETARRWMREQGLEFPVLIDDGYGRQARVLGIPTTWFLDPQGRKVFELLGATDDLENEYVARLDGLRNDYRSEPPGEPD